MDGKYYTRLVELVLPKRARTICTEWQIMQICAIYRVLSLDSEQHSSDELPSCSPCKRCQRKQPMPNPLSPNQAQGMLSSQQSPDQKDNITSWKRVYTTCRWILRGTQWFGTAVILAIFVSLAANLLGGQSSQAGNTLVVSLAKQIQEQQALLLIILGLLLSTMITAWLLILLTPKKDREPSKEEEAKKREEALLKAEDDLLKAEQSTLQTEQRKAALLKQLLDIECEQLNIEREQIALFKQSQIMTNKAQSLLQTQIQQAQMQIEGAIHEAKTDLLAAEQSVLQTEQRKTTLLEQLLDVVKQYQMMTLPRQVHIQIIDKFGRTLKVVQPQHPNNSKQP